MEQLEGENKKDIHGIKGNENDNDKKAKKCPNCGLEHSSQPRSKCPAYGSVCTNCQKENHWARVCRSRAQGGTRDKQKTEKTLGRVLTPGARIDAADEDPQVENAEMAIREN